MEEIIRITAKTLSDTEQILYTNSKGAVIKTIALNNTNSSNVEVTLILDGINFIIPLAIKETKLLSSPMVVNSIKATGNGVNIHISGLQLMEV